MIGKLLRFLRFCAVDTWDRFQIRDRVGARAGLTLGAGVRVISPNRLMLGAPVHLDVGCYLHCGDTSWCQGQGRIEIGSNSYVGPQSVLFGMGGIRIGANVMISPNVVISSVQHPYDDLTTPMFTQPRIYGEVTIDDDVYVGSNAVLTPGVHIGRGAVIGAGAVVTHDVPAFAIAVGVPAKVVADRRPTAPAIVASAADPAVRELDTVGRQSPS